MRRSLPLIFLAGALVAAEPAGITEKYRETANKLIAAAMSDEEGLHRLQYLCDQIGNRLSGTQSLERAITWAASEMKKAGLENVQTPPVKVPHWVRGNESATMLARVSKPLTMIGLGMSIATPKEGVTADVVVADDFDQLTALGRAK